MTAVSLALVCLAATAAPEVKECKRPEVAATASTGDAKAREAAHKGFTYLAKSSIAWTKANSCFGCHVQAVTMEALTAARYFQYDVNPSDLDAMSKALLLGVTAGGHTTGVAFEGAAWARYDKFIDEKQTAQLLKYADELMRLQANDGALHDDDARLPITGGTMQTTYQAAQTWRQAYARTANDRYLSPMRKAERYLTTRADGWKPGDAKVYVQDISFALLGLASAGVTRSEPSSVRLQQLLLARQNHDGGWGLDAKTSDAFATGQAVYTLKMAGFSDSDDAVKRGLAYLLGKQSADGAWRTVKGAQNGTEKGETMWAVLGLVTVDVATVSVAGLTDGQHVGDVMTLDVSAIDNQGGGITELSFSVDDVKVAAECGPKLRVSWNTKSLSTGKHVVDVVAINGKGKQSRRRLEVFAGEVFLTEVGAVFDERAQQTRVSLRNIADPKVKGSVHVEFFTADKKKVFSTQLKTEAGATQFSWDGRDDDKKQLPRAQYVAQVTFRDETGAVKQTETAVFLHDSDDVQRTKYGEVQGSLKLNKLGGLGSANTFVDLVDDKGVVVQTVRSTEQGNYRFKTVNPGQYKVRARKEGYAPLEAPVNAEANKPASSADMAW